MYPRVQTTLALRDFDGVLFVICVVKLFHVLSVSGSCCWRVDNPICRGIWCSPVSQVSMGQGWRQYLQQTHARSMGSKYRYSMYSSSSHPCLPQPSNGYFLLLAVSERGPLFSPPCTPLKELFPHTCLSPRYIAIQSITAQFLRGASNILL